MAKNKKFKSSASYCIPAGLFIGLGLGMMFGEANIGTIIGLGLGFAAYGFLDNYKK